MRLGFGLTQEQTQKLVLTPELRMAIKILQFSSVELAQYVDQQLVENPVLEVEEEAIEQEQDSSERDNTERDNSETEVQTDNFDWDQYFQEKGSVREEGGLNREAESWRYDNLVPQVSTLSDHLLFQMAVLDLNKEEKCVGEFLIGNIDENGYLTCTVEEAVAQYGTSLATVEKMLTTIQGFDPPGVAARDLRECLLIQCEQKGLISDLMKEIISNHLKEVADGKMIKVAKKIGVSLIQMQEAVDCLRLLEPKPGRRFSQTDDTRYIIPDILVEKVGNEYVILVNDITTPRLSISSFYRQMLKGDSSDKEGRKFLESRMNSAVWLIKSIEQRRLTMYKVARCLVDLQMEFFERGIKFLKPLTLKQVAEVLEIHESTVSRTVSNKYMQTPRGVFELKFFFSSGVTTSEGSSASAEAVKKIIKELIEKEDPKKPLSDQKIADLLKERGLEISRRTVAKYRDEMGISATSRRKRF